MSKHNMFNLFCTVGAGANTALVETAKKKESEVLAEMQAAQTGMTKMVDLFYKQPQKGLQQAPAPTSSQHRLK